MDNSWIVKLIDGTIFEITGKEYNSIMGKTGLAFFPSCGRTINLLSISQIIDKKTYEIDELMHRQEKQTTGVLHDGTRIYKRFNVWYFIGKDGEEYVVEENEYPEMKYNCIPTPAEWEAKYKDLTKQERVSVLSEKIRFLRGSHPILSSGDNLLLK